MKAILIIAVIFVLCLTAIGIQLEKKGFNNGVCPRCGTFLRHFDNDSQGGRGYICDKCLYVTWVGFKSVDKNYIR